MNNDLISREWLYKEFKQRQNAALRWKEKAIIDDDEERKIRADATLCFLSEVKLTIDNAPTVEPKLSDEQIEKIADLLETEWGYEGIREDVSRILKEADND